MHYFPRPLESQLGGVFIGSHVEQAYENTDVPFFKGIHLHAGVVSTISLDHHTLTPLVWLQFTMSPHI